MRDVGMRVVLETLAAIGMVSLAGCGSSSPAPGESCGSSALEALSACAKGTTVKGVDVSTYDGTVNWPQAKAAGIDFAFARISDGTANPDATFATNWKGMKAAGVIRGAYQYWRASVDPTAQANLVASSLKAAGGLETGDLPVVMDIETADGQSASTIEAHMTTWLAAVEAATGRKPVIYTSIGTYPITSTAYSKYPLWVANYGVTCPSIPSGWTTWVFWQNSDTGSVGGLSGMVDTDEFNGSLAQLHAFAGGDASDAGAGHDGGTSDAGPGTGSSGGGTGSGSGSGSGSGTSSSSSSGGGGAGGGGAGDAGAAMGAGASGSGASSGGTSSTPPCGH